MTKEFNWNCWPLTTIQQQLTRSGADSFRKKIELSSGRKNWAKVKGVVSFGGLRTLEGDHSPGYQSRTKGGSHQKALPTEDDLLLHAEQSQAPPMYAQAPRLPSHDMSEQFSSFGIEAPRNSPRKPSGQIDRRGSGVERQSSRRPSSHS